MYQSEVAGTRIDPAGTSWMARVVRRTWSWLLGLGSLSSGVEWRGAPRDRA